jgi:hypothetical protein
MCNLIRSRLAEAPYKLKPHIFFKSLARKALHDSLFRSTLLNILKYSARRDLSFRISVRLTRRSY